MDRSASVVEKNKSDSTKEADDSASGSTPSSALLGNEEPKPAILPSHPKKAKPSESLEKQRAEVRNYEEFFETLKRTWKEAEKESEDPDKKSDVPTFSAS